MTGLEAIEIIRDRLVEYKNKADGTNIKCLISPQFAQVRKELKALEIIKEKNVNIGLVKVLGSVEQYNQTYVYDNMLNAKWCLTEEEFNTVKEVLENE